MSPFLTEARPCRIINSSCESSQLIGPNPRNSLEGHATGVVQWP